MSCLESLFVGSKPMVALSLAELPGNTGHLVLAMGGLDNKVHLYCGQRTGKVSNFYHIYPISCCIEMLCGMLTFCFVFIYESSLFVLVS